MKQTAVEYLVKEFSDILGVIKTQLMQDLLLVDAINYAKEMEKQQIIDAYANGHNDGCLYMNNEKQIFEHAEQYYNETFKKQLI